jgi:hypothetical protein
MRRKLEKFGRKAGFYGVCGEKATVGMPEVMNEEVTRR